jgi:hypothetical protein
MQPLKEASCRSMTVWGISLRPTHRNHVWSYCLVADRTPDGRPFRMITIVDEFSRECLAIDVAKRLTSRMFSNGHVESFFRYAPRRASPTGSVRHAPRGQGAHRAVAAALQHRPAAQCPGIPSPSPESRQPCAVATVAPPQPYRAGLLEGKNLT